MTATKTAMQEAIEAALDGLEISGQLPGTRPDLQRDFETVDELLLPILQAFPQADPPDELFAAIEAEIDGNAADQTKSIFADEGAWQRLTDKIWKKVLGNDPATGQSMYLLRCLPGAQILPHPHDRPEHIYIIEGELWMNGKRFGAGDAQTSRPGSQHDLVDIPEGCLVLICA